MLKNKRKFISAVLAIVMIIATLNCSVFSVAAVGTDIDNEDMSNNVSPFSTEQILDALNNAEIIDTSEDSEFILANSSVDINDEYYPDQLYAEIDEESVGENSRATIGDPMVYYTQKWLNQEYGSVSGFTKVTENGKTGWNTIYGLLKALQHELGITTLADNFGSKTQELYSQNILSRQDGKTDNMYAILQCALWCKGYNPGYNFSYNEATGIVSINKVFDADVEKAVKQLQKDANLKNQDGVVSLNVMKSLMSMDSFKLLPSSYGSDSNIREFQQWLNYNYEAYAGISPCDGVYGRNTNNALKYAFQAEEGMPIGTANGTFGDATRRCCPTLPYTQSVDSARIFPGYSDCAYYSNSNITNFTKLLQFMLYVNGFGSGNFNGVYDNTTKLNVRNFQEHYAIDVSGNVDISTWLSLLFSCGDVERKAIAADCATILTKPKADALYANGYRYIGRYLTGTYNGGISKALTRTEAEIILQAGLHFFPIYQTSARQSSYFTSEQGKSDADAAIKAAEALGIPKNTIIYFAVDFDALDSEVTSYVIPYFKAVFEVMSNSIYKTGIYGARNVCSRVSDKGYACSSFVADMSTGFSGNLGYKIPSNWAFDQFADRDASRKHLSIQSEDGAFAIDKDGFSGRDQGVSELDDIEEIDQNRFSPNFGSDTTDKLIGPSLNFFGVNVPLFECEIGLPGNSNEHIRINFDKQKETVEVTIGIKTDTTDPNVKTKDYAEIKSLVNSLGGKTSTQTWNNFQKMRSKLNKSKVQFGFEFDSYKVGYAKFKYVSGDLQIIEGGYGIIAESKVSLTKPIVPLVGIRFDLIGSLETGLKLVWNNSNLSVNGDVEFSLEPRLGFQIGCSSINVYSGISGELNCHLQLPCSSIQEDFTATFQGKGFVEATVLGQSFYNNFVFNQLQLYPKQDVNSSYTYSLSRENMLNIEPISNTNPSYRNNSNSMFEERAQVYASPKIVSLGDGKMFMAYISDEAERSSTNRYILMYSVYNGTTWSVPKAILDDGTADFEPEICSDGNGGVYIVWQNANSIFNDEAPIEQISKNVELYYTHWNGSDFVDTVSITSNNANYETSQKISVNENNLSIIWIENEENDLFATGGNSIHRKQFINGVWNDTEVLAYNLSIINSLNTSYIDDKNIVIYSAKASDDYSTLNDYELFCIKDTEITRLTNNEVPDYSIVFVDGDLYWISGNSIMVARNGNMDNKQIIKTLNSAVSKIKVIREPDYNESIVWEIEDTTGMTFYGINYNSVSDSFGDIYPLSTDSGVVRGWDACFNSNGDIELAFCYADYTEDNLYGDLYLIQKQAEEYYDIYVTPNATYTGAVLPNNTITVSTQVYNTGSKVIEGFNVELINENGEMLQSTIVNKEVGIGKSSDIEVAFTLPASISKTEYRLVVTPLNAVISTFADNISNFTIGLPDISIVNVDEIRDENLRQIKVTIKNEGYFPVSSAALELHAGKYDGNIIGSNTITVLQPNEEIDFIFTLGSSYSAPSALDDPKLVYVTLKTDDIESDYLNNTFEYYVYPDCTVDVIAGTIGGYVAGSGIFPKNSTITITAVPSAGYAFQGWYENGVRIFGAESIYLFSVLKSSELEARFIKLNDCDTVNILNKNVIVDEENKYLLGLPSGEKIEDYFAATDNGSIVQVKNSFGMINATGSQAQIVSKDGVVIDVYTVIIPGDVNGDSAIDTFDVFYIDRHINTANKLSGAYLAAADINRDGVVDESDYNLCFDLALSY